MAMPMQDSHATNKGKHAKDAFPNWVKNNLRFSPNRKHKNIKHKNVSLQRLPQFSKYSSVSKCEQQPPQNLRLKYHLHFYYWHHMFYTRCA